MTRIFLIFYLFVVHIFLLVQFVLNPVLNILIEDQFQQPLSEYYRELIKGTFSLAQQDLLPLSTDQRQDRIRQLQPAFGYPLELKGSAELDLSPRERQQLDDGQILVRAGGNLFLQRLGSENMALVMGPFPEYEVNKSQHLMVWGLVLTLVAGLTMLWTLPFWNKLRKISASAVEFGQGNLDRRVRISRHSSLWPLAEAFNKMADRIQGLISAQQDLTNAVSHELRTPIARLRFGLEMYESCATEEAKARYAEGMNRDIDELDDLVSEILTYSRLNRELPSLRLEEQAIVPWLHQAAAALGHLATGQTHIQCITRPLSEELTVRFDARLMERAVLNLLQNAIRYGNGRVQLSLEVGEGTCSIRVDDDGPGIPAAERQRIFEPFTRLESSRNRATGGFGLGLAIVKGVADSHRGSVDIATSPLGGCRVTLQWPSG